MMKKNYLFSMLTMMMVALLSFSVTACGDDDDDENGSSQPFPYGEWKGYYMMNQDQIYQFVIDKTTITQTDPKGVVTKGTYTIESTTTDKIDKSKRIKGMITWNDGRTMPYEMSGSNTMMTLTINNFGIYMLYRVSKNRDSGKTGSNTLVGRWEGDHSEKYFEDWTINKDGSGEQHIEDDGLGSFNKFTYTISDQQTGSDNYGPTLSGKINIKFSSGRNVSWSFYLQNNKWLSINGYSMSRVK